MENPYAPSNRHISELYFNLGQAMKQYVIAILASCGIGIIGLFLTISMGPYVTSEVYALSGSAGMQIVTLAAIPGIFSFLWIGLFTYIAVRYFQYLSKLKALGNQLGDVNLQKTYKMEIGAITSGIFLVIFVIIILMPISRSLLYNPARFNVSGLIGLIFLIFFGGIAVYIFQIMSVVHFDRWSYYLQISDPNITTYSIKEGMGFMKFGRILNPFVSGIGEIFYMVGMWKSGQNLIKYSGMNNTRVENPSIYGQFSEPHTRTYRPLQMHPTPSRPQHFFCSNCGNKITPPESKFCQNCGNKLF
ncbi:hypothetical protein NEF87_000561 [Candidatus Lokiarchaeum ossiferum]|uniref:Zinc-ribbon domain-containing protein n=1 Tax=Candidatus Lokiarchaeum ossiferum TaxID=2951803 RepID=A0ABY6HL88_9ARCH|nr:hypothetical protein NEF87_000561 [Candidatus Lokiarchaeum sp. B-35]